MEKTSSHSHAGAGHSTSAVKPVCELHACTVCWVIDKGTFICFCLTCETMCHVALSFELPRDAKMQKVPTAFDPNG